MDTLDVGKGPCAKSVKEGDVDVDAKVIGEDPLAKVFCEGGVGVETEDVSEVPHAKGHRSHVKMFQS